jgi:thymidylate kinase
MNQTQLILITALTKLGFRVSAEKTVAHGVEIPLHVRNNPDGTARWIWPTTLKSPDFLAFYLESTWRSKLLASGIRGLFATGLQRGFVSSSLSVWMNEEDAKLWSQRFGEEWSLFTGTVGPYRKAIVHFKKDKASYFVKVGMTELSNMKLQVEWSFLDQMEYKRIPQLSVPRAWNLTRGVVMMEDVKNGGQRESRLTNLHWFALRNIYRASTAQMPIGQVPAFQRALQIIEKLSHSNDARLPSGMLSKIKALGETINPNQVIRVSIAHGDFTPWNMYVNGDKLHVYDWEMASPEMPILFDAFHFISQSAILEHRWDFARLWDEVDMQMSGGIAQQILHETGTDLVVAKKLYYFLFVASQLEMYHQQEKWHMQVDWLINAWNEAISKLLHQEKMKTSRQLILIDAFDFLKLKKYACLKWNHTNIIDLPSDSDVDMVMSKMDASAFESMLRNHPLVERVFKQARSFMTTIQVETNEGEWLTFDLISKLKRKSIEFMSADQVIANSVAHPSGVQVASLTDQFFYSIMFFTLNGAVIPEKYIQFYEQMSDEESAGAIEQLQAFLGVKKLRMYDVLHSSKKLHGALVDKLQAQEVNRGWQGLKNKMSYVYDNLPLIHHQRGFIITFSGVDGAGKSTVIEHVKTHLEKVMRRRVVVIRHRPSLLPILSAYTHGKKEAEKMAAERLPRKGTNRSVMSSLFRFGYYYIDYLIGQFVVKIKYTMRGYVVLYDRYYYDFMHDSKRSNITLPPFVTNLGFKLLMKPQLNFFLYASASAIRKRKQELDIEEINELSEKYLKHFDALNREEGSARFVTIHNVHLENTLRVIQHQISQQVV